MEAETAIEIGQGMGESTFLTPLQKDVYLRLLKYIGDNSLKEGDKLPSFKELAGEFGVSLKVLQTVIPIMSRDGVVQTVPYVGTFVARKKKTEASKPKGKGTPPEKAKPAERRKEKRVALILPWNVPEIMDNIQCLLQEAGIGLLTFFTPVPNATATKMQLLSACSHGVDGIICFTSKISLDHDIAELLKRVRQKGIHVITVDAETPHNDSRSNFYLGFAAAFRELCAHLKEQGYRQVHYATNTHTPDEREKLFAASASEHGLRCGRRIRTDAGDLDGTVKNIAREPGPKAFYCDNDFAAIECLKHLRGRKRIPDEIGLVASCDILLGNQYRLGELISPTLTTLQFPFARLAESVVLNMISDINLGPIATLNEPSECLPIKLIIRESTMRNKISAKKGGF